MTRLLDHQQMMVGFQSARATSWMGSQTMTFTWAQELGHHLPRHTDKHWAQGKGSPNLPSYATTHEGDSQRCLMHACASHQVTQVSALGIFSSIKPLSTTTRYIPSIFQLMNTTAGYIFANPWLLCLRLMTNIVPLHLLSEVHSSRFRVHSWNHHLQRSWRKGEHQRERDKERHTCASSLCKYPHMCWLHSTPLLMFGTTTMRVHMLINIVRSSQNMSRRSSLWYSKTIKCPAEHPVFTSSQLSYVSEHDILDTGMKARRMRPIV